MKTKCKTELLKNEYQELLPWVWAIQSQLGLLDNNDALWIEEANSKKGWPEESFYKFLNSYSLLRGHKGAVLAKGDNQIKGSRKALIRICEKHFRVELDEKNWVAQIGSKWRAADAEFAAWVSDHDGPQAVIGQMFMPSALKKSFWYYQPNILTMYDSLSCVGLRNSDEGNAVNPNNFLDRFYVFHQNSGDFRTSALKYFDHQYPYEYRITDKYLWLMGNRGKDQILKNYLASIRLQQKWQSTNNELTSDFF